MTGPPPQRGEEHKFLANLFHLISQPMTALQCSLEFALNKLDDPPQCRTWIETALENSERLRCRLALAREVADAARPGDPAQTAELKSVLQEVLSEAEPLFEFSGTKPRLQCDEIQVSGERGRLLRGFLHILQNLDAPEAPAPEAPEVSAERQGELIEVRFSRFVLKRNASKDQVASQLEIAKEIFESAGGGLIFFCFAGNDALVRVLLRTPQAQLALYEQALQKEAASAFIGTTTVFPQVS